MGKPFIVIIAGGRGERFWPQSRAARPKHLLPVVGDKPLLTQTLERVKPLVPPSHIFVITSKAQETGVRQACRGLPAGNIVAEPIGRDTAAAVGLAAALVGARDPNGVFAVLPADHVIHATQKYQADLKAALAAAAAEPVIVTIGITPSEPATGFGYVQRAESWRHFDRKEFFHVRRFVEKPALDVAQQYVASGDYFWNAGMFVWSVPVVEQGLAQHAPELDAGLRSIRAALAAGKPIDATLRRVYPKLEKISIDYALLEKSRNVVVMRAGFDWDDVGAWPAVARHYQPDAAGNVTRGPALIENGRGNIVFSEGRHLVTVVGADNLVVVHTPEATLVCPKEKAQDIKALLKRIEQRKDAKLYL